MNQDLYQKYHGLPGIGVSGKTGDKGKKGAGVYIGFVNDFFNTNSVDVDTIVRVARQISNPNSGFTGSFFPVNNNTAIADAHFVDNDFLEFTCLSDVFTNSKSGRQNYYELYQMGYGDTPSDKTKWNYSEEVEQYISPTRVVVDMRHLPYQYDTDGYDDEAIANGDDVSAKGVTVLYGATDGTKYFTNSKAYLTADQIVPKYEKVPKDRLSYDSSYVRTSLTKNINDTKIKEGLFFDASSKSYYVVPGLAEENKEDYTEYAKKYSEIFDSFYNTEGNATRIYNNLTSNSLVPDSDADYYAEDHNGKNLNYVLWEEQNAQAVAVPTTLKEEFVEGDILYVYTNKNRFEHNNYKIDYMINVTKDMLGANYSYVISHAVASKPFAFAEFTTDNNKVVLNNGINLITYDISTNSLMSRMKAQFVENYNEQLEFNDYIVEISEFSENSKDCKFLSLSSSTNGVDINNIANLSFDSSFILDASLSQDSSGMKFSSLYVNDSMKTPQLYAKNLLLPSYVNFTNELFLPALEESAYNDSDATFRINKSDYIIASSGLLENGECNYGAIIIDNKTGECKETINPSGGKLCLDVKFYGASRQKYIENCSYDFSIIPFVDPEGSMRYFGRQTNITIDVDKDGNVLRTIDSKSSGTYNNTIIWQDNNDVEFTLIGNIGVESTENASVKISLNNSSIKTDSVRVYINGKDDITTGTAQNYDWVEISYTNDDDVMFVGLKNIESNLPNWNGVNHTTIDEYFADSDFTSIDSGTGASNIFSYIKNKSLISTLERKLLLTVAYKFDYETESDETHKVFYWITQPGFTDPRVLPSVEFTNRTSQIELENTNSNDNGVLGNQFQYLIDISINGFSSEEWAKYSKDITVDLTIESMNDSFETMSSYAYAATKKYANIKQVFEKEGNLGDEVNSFYTSFYIQTPEADPEKLSVKELEENSTTADGGFSWTVDSSYYLSVDNNIYNLEVNDVYGSKYVKMISEMYTPEESACRYNNGVFNNVKFQLSNIPIEYLQNTSNHLKIRVMFEQSNPVITRIKYNFVVTDMAINYKGTLFHFSDNQTYELNAEPENRKEFLYSVFDDQLNGFIVPNFMSGEQEFYLRPVSMIAAPIKAETSTGLRYSTVKMSGSEDTIKLGLTMYAQDYFTLLSNISASMSERNRLFKSGIEWDKAILKKRYFQDDIADIQVLANDPYSVFNKISESNSFLKTLYSFDDNFAPSAEINSQESENDFQTNYASISNSVIVNANEQEFPIFRNFGKLSSIYNVFGSEAPYLSVTYRSDWTHPKLRNDKNTFYYNDKLYEVERYSQYESNSPMYVSIDANVKIRTQNLLDSMETWNFEYHHSGYASYVDTYEGKVSIYSTGYEYLSNDADYGQYEKTKDASTLAETREANEELVLDIISLQELPLCKYEELYPKANKNFRSILYGLKWQYPVFASADSYYGYDIVSPLISTMNNAYLQTAYKHNYEMYSSGMNLYNDDVLPMIDKEFIDTYKNIANKFLELKSEDSRNNPEKKEFYNMIPYNILFNIYPRITYNDEKGSVTVLTLRRPSVCDQDSSKLEKHYFEMTSYPECEQPYKL